MLERFIKIFNEGSLYYGLEIAEHNNELTFYLSEIKRKNNELSIKKMLSETNLASISSTIRKNTPVILTLNTSEIVTKIIASPSSKNPEIVVREQFPNLDFNSFYYSFTQNDGYALVSILKKGNLESYLENISNTKITICKVIIGISEIDTIVSYLKSDVLQVSNSVLYFENNKLKDSHKLSSTEIDKPKTYNLNEITISGQSILGFASVLTFIAKKRKTITNFDEKEENLITEFKGKRYFDILLKLSLGGIFTILLLNFLIFSYYFEEVNSLKSVASFNNENKKVLIDLKEDVERKEKRVETIFSSSNSKSSFFLDQIALNIPNSLSLSSLEYQPLLKPIRESKDIQIGRNTIIINGNSNNSQEFSEWIQTLETLKWVQQIQILDYDYENASSSLFSIKIEMNEK
tara:strand:+ start:25717 stop:26934 length:1218 start_codon:yes stop_codon:yes gene_type:complete